MTTGGCSTLNILCHANSFFTTCCLLRCVIFCSRNKKQHHKTGNSRYNTRILPVIFTRNSARRQKEHYYFIINYAYFTSNITGKTGNLWAKIFFPYFWYFRWKQFLLVTYFKFFWKAKLSRKEKLTYLWLHKSYIYILNIYNMTKSTKSTTYQKIS